MEAAKPNSAQQMAAIWGGAGRGALPRFAGGLLVALVIAGALFVLMMALVFNSNSGITEDDGSNPISFVRPPEPEPEPKTKERKPPDEPEPPDEPPPPSQPTTSTMAEPQPQAPNLDVPNIDTASNLKGQPFMGNAGGPTAAGQGAGAGNVGGSLQVVKQVSPTYPSTAKQAQIEGKVTMSFTVNPDGSVSNIEIIEANPPRMFDAAAKQAMGRWRFKPAKDNGQAVAKRATQTMNFTLNN
ncbi:energy transducer TonB [uncultured Salinisphaera sp.]|uniref:energy transducer TonB n=1 Tax=uncultured Salinisphaera sp. TaxID=359372 RepID=UPI0032B240C6